MRTRFALVAVIALALAGCASSPEVTTPGFPVADDLDGSWRLTSGTDTTGAFDLGDTEITLELDDRTASGNAGCNSYTGEFGVTVDGGISFGPFASTKMACSPDSVMDLESRYLAGLEAVDTATLEIDGFTLSLNDDVLELVFAEVDDKGDDESDGAGAGDVDEAALVGTTWSLESIGGTEAAVVVDGEASLVFGDDGSIHGSAGCRGFEGDYVDRPSGSISITRIEIDAADCPESIGTQETLVFDVIGEGFTATIADNRLTLSKDGSSISLVYRPLED
ncbi:heat shock protein HslJ [Conyzicola lurida]|uniref:Heat shock protein HslJ n=1 Tax=Conyzicola lurida TaxID=1172621 RepID=A0A841AQU8_9MICO|nr:META domain-containing protein [Conyzicola lurida]MBB5843799.1 heat shock protein HslJ [Conyzicola lurida]